jgi:integrase/recombinase XerD
LSPGSVARHLAALKFFYTKTLKKAWSIAETPYPKRAFRLPSILSQEEVARLIDAARRRLLCLSSPIRENAPPIKR